MTEIRIGNYRVGENFPPFIIAELSGNHGQDLATALAMIDAAALAGVHAIKLQTYTADTMTLDIDSDEFLIKEEDSLWHGEKLHQLYKKAATPYSWHKQLFDHAKSLGLEAFSSPFDEAAVDFLDDLNVPCFKIASFEITDLPLISKAASKGKPLIISTGMASIEEINDAILTAQSAGCHEIILLKCTSTYPASSKNSNLSTIPDMKEKFNCLVGLSDHSAGIGVAVTSVAFGIVIIEKHFVLDRAAGGVDAEFSLQPEEFTHLVVESNRAWQSIGEVTYGGTTAEEASKQYRRSIYVTRDISAGTAFTIDNIKIIRPAFGLEPRYWQDVLGKLAKFDIEKGTALNWQLVK
ncbi:MAG: pseudaminic acid synthase [Gammaproteobacteria bacterium]|nr:MAG: pseudaminic acid synthase [Gammaproteobacteria bacterium]